MADGAPAPRFALEQRDVQARPIGNTSRDGTLSAAVARHPAAVKTDSRELKLVPFGGALGPIEKTSFWNMGRRLALPDHAQYPDPSQLLLSR
jgi:hypothetical protein